MIDPEVVRRRLRKLDELVRRLRAFGRRRTRVISRSDERAWPGPMPGRALHPELLKVLGELHARLERLYGDRLVEVLLFGSRARGEADPESDIDVLVVLREPVRPATEIARTGDIVAGLSLEHDVVISCVFMDENRYRTRAGPLLRNVRREGIPV